MVGWVRGERWMIGWIGINGWLDGYEFIYRKDGKKNMDG